jgi:hypothetical protein
LTVLNHRGNSRLNIAAGAGGGKRRQVLLPIPWECNQVDQIRDAVVRVDDEFQQGIEPDACVARIPRAEQEGAVTMAEIGPGMTPSEISAVVPHGLREPAQPLFLQGGG